MLKSLLHKNLGAIFIIAGTTIGASMLALPAITASFGFLPSLAILAIMWIIMAYASLVSLELNSYSSKALSISSLSKIILGTPGYLIAIGALLLLFYALLAAYIAGSSSILHQALPHIPQPLIAITITLTFGFTVSYCTKSADYLNRFLFLVKVIAFTLMLFTLLPHTSKANLFPSDSNFAPLLFTLPIFFTAFGFHGSIPAVINYLGTPSSSHAKIFLLGSFLPLLFYSLWQFVSLGSLPLHGPISFDTVALNNNDVGSFVSQLNQISHSSSLSLLSSLFSFLAIITSFIGVGLGLIEFLSEKTHSSNPLLNKLSYGSLAFAPPLAFALFFPKGFILALGYASIALTLQAIIMPALCLLKLRSSSPNSPSYRAPGGNTALLSLLSFGLLIIALELYHLL